MSLFTSFAWPMFAILPGTTTNCRRRDTFWSQWLSVVHIIRSNILYVVCFLSAGVKGQPVVSPSMRHFKSCYGIVHVDRYIGVQLQSSIPFALCNLQLNDPVLQSLCRTWESSPLRSWFQGMFAEESFVTSSDAHLEYALTKHKVWEEERPSSAGRDKQRTRGSLACPV